MDDFSRIDSLYFTSRILMCILALMASLQHYLEYSVKISNQNGSLTSYIDVYLGFSGFLEILFEIFGRVIKIHMNNQMEPLLV